MERPLFVAAACLCILPPTVGAQQHIPRCQQAPSANARTARIDANVAITGAGRIDIEGGRSQYIWTGRDCIAWVIAGGRLRPMPDERDVIAEIGAEFVAFEQRDSLSREYRVTPTATRYSVNGREATPAPGDHAWIAEMVEEYVRRAGVGADARATRILSGGGIAALLEEVRRIHPQRVRLMYLLRGLDRTTDTDRTMFLRDAALLLETGPRASFLLSIPRSWRTSPAVLEVVYAAALGIESDSDVATILMEFPPPQQLTAGMQPLLQALLPRGVKGERR